MKKSLIDAGPLIAMFDKDDDYHPVVMKFLCAYKGSLITSWAVVTEVLHMLDFSNRAQIDFLEWIYRDALEIQPINKKQLLRIIELSKKYSDIPMDFADATLVVIAETENVHDIITIDSDFHVYKDFNKRGFRNLLR